MAEQSPQSPLYEKSVRETKDGRITTDDAAGAETRSFQTRPGDTEPVDDNNGAQGWPLTADPADVARARDQGLGLGQKELDAQRDPAGTDSADHYGDPARGADADEGAMANDPDPRQARS